MPHREGASTSLWMATARALQPPPLSHDEEADVCVIGAGIAGLTVAYRLARAGQRVIVLDERGIGLGQTARSTAHLCNALDDRYYELIRLHGEDGARMAAQSHATAIDAIETICRDEAIECDFSRVDGYLVDARGEEGSVELECELQAARRVGVAVERLHEAPGPWAAFGPVLRFPRQAQFHPICYLDGLAQAVQRHGGRLHGRTRVTALHGGSHATVETEHGARVRAGAIVVATNTPFNDRIAIHSKQAAYRTYVVALRLPPQEFPAALLWDTGVPYHYVRIAQASHEYWLIVGGEDHKVGQEEDPTTAWEQLEVWARRRFPMAGEVGHRWSGQVHEPVDALAFIGRNPGDAENVYVVTGDSGNGLTHGTIAGELVTQLILGEPSPWAWLYAPDRINTRSTERYVRENLNTMAQYYDLFTGGEVESLAQIAPGTGAIMRDGLSKRAVYRDRDGQYSVHSAICPHLGGVVHWNAAECSWDCPAHGSRFDARDGRCLHGPAAHGLAPAVLGEALPPPPRPTLASGAAPLP